MTQIPLPSFEEIVSIATVLGPAISLVLTLLLVILYYQQYKIITVQTEYSKAEQQSLPRVWTYDLFSWLDLYRYNHSEDSLPEIRSIPEFTAIFTANVSNEGKGIAEDMRTELVIKSPNYQCSVTSPLTYRTNVDQVAFSGVGGVLSPEEGTVRMVSDLSFDPEDVQGLMKDSGITVGDYVSPSEILWMLENVGETPVDIAIFIHYKDGTGIREPIQLLTSRNDLSPYIDIRTSYVAGGPCPEDVTSMYDLEESYDDSSPGWQFL